MKAEIAIDALSALAHETRLETFRLLVRAGDDGTQASVLAERLGVARPVMSFHLRQLEGAGLVTIEKQGRERIYRAQFAAMRGLIAFLTEDCCTGLGVTETAGACEESER